MPSVPKTSTTSLRKVSFLRKSAIPLARFTLLALLAVIPAIVAIQSIMVRDQFGLQTQANFLYINAGLFLYCLTLLIFLQSRPASFRRLYYILGPATCMLLPAAETAQILHSGVEQYYLLFALTVGIAILFTAPLRLVLIVFTLCAFGPALVLSSLRDLSDTSAFYIPFLVTLALGYITIFAKDYYWTGRFESRMDGLRLAILNKILSQKNSELRSTKEVLEKERNFKNVFLAKLSAEFRTPVSAILTSVDLLTAGKELSAEQREYLDYLRTSARELQSLVDSFLDLSQLESPERTLNEHPFHVLYTLERILTPLKISAREKGLAFEQNLDPELPTQLNGDSFRLSQLMTFLIQNAIKFTDSGKVRVDVTVEDIPDSDHVVLKLEVADTGIGVKDEEKEFIFDTFVQGGRAGSAGTGLGLAVVRSITLLMGGHYKVDSPSPIAEPDRPGAVFQVSVPFKVLGHAESGLTALTVPREEKLYSEVTQRLPDGQSLKVLYAEDNRVNQMLVKAILEKMGQDVEVAADGRSAVDMFQSRKFDLIFMDLEMPVMSGLDATAQIRELERKEHRPRTPVIGISGHAYPEARRLALDSGMDTIMAKPVTKKQLARMIELHQGNNASQKDPS